jgi:hypothetical protein
MTPHASEAGFSKALSGMLLTVSLRPRLVSITLFHLGINPLQTMNQIFSHRSPSKITLLHDLPPNWFSRRFRKHTLSHG